MRIHHILLVIAVACIHSISFSQLTSELNENRLTISNNVLEREFLWNNGEIISYSLRNLKNGEEYLKPSDTPALHFGKYINLKDTSYEKRLIPASNRHVEYLETEIILDYGDFKIKRIFTISEGVRALRSENYLWIDPAANVADIEKTLDTIFSLEEVHVISKYPRLKAIEFYDRTDTNNNLVRKDVVNGLHHPLDLKGNILQITAPEGNKGGIYMLKEAPSSFVQLDYHGHDFTTLKNHISVIGMGQPPGEFIEGEWVQLYGNVIGFYDGTEKDFIASLHTYQKSLRKSLPERDEMIMMNTWGDRSRDANINETFLKAELDACEKLGISHFQIDDGWQQGLSENSANKSGNKWDLWEKEDWAPHKDRLPNGLKPIKEYADSKGIQLGLWFHPTNANDYVSWERDAESVLKIFKETGIRYFKIDGIDLPNKISEHRLGMFFEKLAKRSNGEIVINLDATALSRTGYHYKNTYGNIFLENRYTDFGSYYPHWTLRNLWQLSTYVRTQSLQIEFLNKWRNHEVYGIKDDLLAPFKIPFEYQFAITMMAQPLAWFEGTGLPKEGFEIAPVIKKYRSLQTDIHSGDIYPIGEEPSGYGWTGFQSILDDKNGYLLVFREKNEIEKQLIQTWLPSGKKIRLDKVLGDGESTYKTTSLNGELEFSLPEEFSYTLYRYNLAE